MRRARAWTRWSTLSALLATAACSGGDARPAGPGSMGSGPDAAAGQATGNTGGNGAAGTPATGGTLFSESSGGMAGELNADAACAAESTRAENIPVDMYIMLDSSGSMEELTGAGPSKWSSVTEALRQFLEADRSQGLGVGIQFFPRPGRSVPATCRSDAECGNGAYGFCALRFCSTPIETPDGLSVLPCQTDAACAAESLGTCDVFGQCAGEPESLCFPVGATCLGVQPPGCVPLASSTCTDPDCDVGVYADPTVPIGPLPQNAAAVLGAVNAQQPSGRTPTAASLQGAIDHAAIFATMNPSHRVVVLYVTDGLPTECARLDVADIAPIAAAGLAGTPSVRTFAIGVFTPTTEGLAGRRTVNAIAAAGGTDSAFIVDPSGNVASQFLDALDQIRGGTLGCEFQIPAPPMGESRDFDRVNVTFHSNTEGERTIPFVTSADDCARVAQGWHYDVDPAAGAPASIVACPQTCDWLTSAAGAQVDIALGCQTQHADPR